MSKRSGRYVIGYYDLNVAGKARNRSVPWIDTMSKGQALKQLKEMYDPFNLTIYKLVPPKEKKKKCSRRGKVKLGNYKYVQTL